MRIDPYIEKLKDIPVRLTDVLNRVLQALNAGVEFGNPSSGPINIRGVWVQGTTPGVADQEFIVTHNLNYIPSGVLTFSVDQSATLYKGATPWTVNQLSLKCHQTGVNYTIFIS